MYRICTISELESQLEASRRKKMYLVGAGDCGDYLGAYLDYRDIDWIAYLDNYKTGVLNDKKIYSFDYLENNSYLTDGCLFFITAPHFADSISEQLKRCGVNEKSMIYVDNIRVIYELYGKISPIMRKLLEGSYREYSMGERDPEKTYMVLERSTIYEGITSNMRRFMIGIDYADRCGFVPLIDQTYYPAFDYQNLDRLGAENPWEYFFEQPGGVSLDYVKENGCKNVRYYNMDDSANIKFLSEGLYVKENGIDRLSHWHQIANKYFRLNSAMQKRVDEEYNSLFPRHERVVGVKIREGMMKSIENKTCRGGLPWQPDVDRIIDEVRENMVKWGDDFIYLMCETSNTKELFEKEFGDKLIVPERSLREYDELPSESEQMYNWLHDAVVDRKEKAEDYVSELYLLSKCDDLISGCNGTMEMACVIKGGYDHMVIHYSGYSPCFAP